MKYFNTHHQLPESGQPVYFLGPKSLEVLGHYIDGKVFFCALDKSVQGYYSKFWRNLNESEMALLPQTQVAFLKDTKEQKRQERKERREKRQKRKKE